MHFPPFHSNASHTIAKGNNVHGVVELPTEVCTLWSVHGIWHTGRISFMRTPASVSAACVASSRFAAFKNVTKLNDT